MFLNEIPGSSMKSLSQPGADPLVTSCAPAVARLSGVSLQYGKVRALDRVDLEVMAGRMVGLIGPDGVGKSSILGLISGARRVHQGRIEVLGGDMKDTRHRREVCPRIAYMPQGLGKNLYATLSVFENVDFFGRLFGHGRSERERRIKDLLESTGLAPFSSRPAGKLSGGMKQKLGLCCALIHDPDLLILDEPTTGVDPLSRRQFWELIARIRRGRPGMSVLVATAYMDEASRFDWLVAMDEGRVLATGTPEELLKQTRAGTLEKAFVALLPDAKREEYREVVIPPRSNGADGPIAIESKNLTMRFGDFIAVDRVSFRIERGEIFGFLGSNGCGKTTTMKMLTGLLPASRGEAWLFGKKVDATDLENRRRVGYMSQGFSLYSELTVRQNLELHARLFHVPASEISGRVEKSVTRFGLEKAIDSLPDSLPLGQRQRLSLAVALIHEPELLILDEPTSGVDPIARDAFWQILVDLARSEHVTIFISTHFVDESQRCDRISLMHAGKVLVSGTPAELTKNRGAATLEDAFIGYLEEAATPGPTTAAQSKSDLDKPVSWAADGKEIGEKQEGRTPLHERKNPGGGFSIRRMLSFSWREALELKRDPIRLTLALLGSLMLMVVMSYGITMDVEGLTFAVLDRDQTTASHDYVLNLAGSRYFLLRPPITDYEDLDRRMKSGQISLAIEIPPNFDRELEQGNPVEIGAWIDGSNPQRAETIGSYVLGMHSQWLAARTIRVVGHHAKTELATIETRYRYNPDVKSLIAMVPAMIPLLLMLIPAMLSALSVVREKELGSIVNLYVTPVTRLEFLFGKQIPYVALGLLNFLVLVGFAVTLFGVPLKGSFAALLAGAVLYVVCSTGIGLLISTFMRSQIAAIFGTSVLSILPAVQFSGIIDPVSSLEGPGALIGMIYPTTHFVIITRGTFSKALGFVDLYQSFLPLLIAVPVLVCLNVALLKKQEG